MKLSDDEILELYQQGLTNREIADALQVTQGAIHYRLEKLGLVNNLYKTLEADPEQVRILYGVGLTVIGIAYLLKVNAAVIQLHLKEMGLEDNAVKLKEIFSQC